MNRLVEVSSWLRFVVGVATVPLLMFAAAHLHRHLRRSSTLWVLIGLVLAFVGEVLEVTTLLRRDMTPPAKWFIGSSLFSVGSAIACVAAVVLAIKIRKSGHGI